MDEILKIPERFFGLFQSQNRYIYMESLILIYEEYLYNDYFLTKDTCILLLTDYFSLRSVDVSADRIEEEDTALEQREPVAAKILNRLLYFGWIKKIEDYTSFRTNIAIPEYSAMFIDVFNRINHPEDNEADLYIQNVYTNIYSFYHDEKAGIEILMAAKTNISRVNRALQNLLHNMDEFFGTLLRQNSYETLLSQHLEVFVEDSVHKKYSLLKTGDNFYIFKNDIKTLLKKIREDESRLSLVRERLVKDGRTIEEADRDLSFLADAIERGLDNMEKRIAYIDTEYSKYIKATVNRLEYLLNQEEDTKGSIAELFRLFEKRNKDKMLSEVSKKLNFQELDILSQDSFYKKKKKRIPVDNSRKDEVEKELSRDEVLLMNKLNQKYTGSDIENFILSQMKDGALLSENMDIEDKESFELLILAYDYGIRKSSPYFVELEDRGMVKGEAYSYPRLTFRLKNKGL